MEASKGENWVSILSTSSLICCQTNMVTDRMDYKLAQGLLIQMFLHLSSIGQRLMFSRNPCLDILVRFY